LKLRHAALVTEIEILQETKKALQDAKDERKEVLQEAKIEEAALKKNLGRRQNSVVAMVEKVFVAHSIAKPYYHGGKYNGKAMNTFMTKSENVMESLNKCCFKSPMKIDAVMMK